jgi:branched-chain amino acid transport system permease protein
MFWQQVISGAAAGSIYALLAVAMVLIYKTTNIVNFAQGEMAMFTTFISYTFLFQLGQSYVVSLGLTLILSAVAGIITELLFMRPLRNAPGLNSIIVTLGLMLILNNLAAYIWGRDPLRFPSPVSEKPLKIANLVISQLHLAIILVSGIVMLALYLFLKYSKEGTAMRAAIQNQRAALLMGIEIGRVFSLAWVVGTVIGALAGMLTAPLLFLDYNMMFMVLLKAFAAAVLGGISSLPGAVVGGLTLGMGENLIGGYLSSSFKDSLSFMLIVAVLLIRPTGILGKAVRKKV